MTFDAPTEDVLSKAVYVAFDPGETTGWALFDENGDGIAMGQFKQADLVQATAVLIRPGMKEVICEEYRNYAWQKQAKWSRNQTSKNEGKFEYAADLHQVPFVLQPASVKGIGYKWAGLGEAPSNHSISHQYDAYVHGVYRLQTIGVRPAGRSQGL